MINPRSPPRLCPWVSHGVSQEVSHDKPWGLFRADPPRARAGRPTPIAWRRRAGIPRGAARGPSVRQPPARAVVGSGHPRPPARPPEKVVGRAFRPTGGCGQLDPRELGRDRFHRLVAHGGRGIVAVARANESIPLLLHECLGAPLASAKPDAGVRLASLARGASARDNLGGSADVIPALPGGRDQSTCIPRMRGRPDKDAASSTEHRACVNACERELPRFDAAPAREARSARSGPTRESGAAFRPAGASSSRFPARLRQVLQRRLRHRRTRGAVVEQRIQRRSRRGLQRGG